MQTPFVWHGTGIPERIKAMILQLNPDDDEAERDERMSIERRMARELANAMQDHMAVLLPPGADDMDPTDVARAVTANAAMPQRVRDILARELTRSADLGVSVAARQFENVGFGFDWTMVNVRAREWAEQHAGALIRDIDDTTRRTVQQAIGRWMQNGDPLGGLTEDLTGLFGRRRAELIAATEVTRAFAEANRIAYRESGVVSLIKWRTAMDERVCPICGPLGNADPAPLADGVQGIFPPAHPGCRCWIVPMIMTEQEYQRGRD